MKIYRILTAAALGLLITFATAAGASAHPHTVTTGNGETVIIANGQNHPPFVDGVSCEGVNEPEDSGPAGYGLETAHHGPDMGTPGKADGCFESDGADRNPAID